MHFLFSILYELFYCDVDRKLKTRTDKFFMGSPFYFCFMQACSFITVVYWQFMLQLLTSLQWAEAIESLDYDSRSDKSFGMKQRPDGDIEIDEKFWEEEFHIPNCQKCNGILKPDVSTCSFHVIWLLHWVFLHFSAV